MFGKNSKILIIGAGAIGGITAGFLSKGGYNVQIVDKNPDIVEIIKSKELHIYGKKGDFKISIPAFSSIDQISEKKDLILLATKATAMPFVVKDLIPILKENSVVVSLQNGICEEIIAEIIGIEATIGCVVGWGATMNSPGELEMTSTGEFVIGRIDNKEDKRLDSIKEILQTIVPTDTSNNILGNLYSKLIISSCITTLGAICGLYLGEMLAIKKIRNIFICIVREAIDVANALNITVEPYANKLNYYSFLKGKGFLANLKRHTLIRLIGYKYKKVKSSSLQSLERGELTEIDYFNGYIFKKGQQNNVKTPLNECLTNIVKEIEVGKRKIALSNFDEPFFNQYK